MSTETTLALPGTPGKRLRAAWEGMSPELRAAFLPHLVGGTSAEWLSNFLGRLGFQVSASSIRFYRRALRQAGV